MALPKRQLRTLHLFAGAGGGILSDLILGHRPVCAVELDAFCRDVLLARQRDGFLPRFPVWDDVRTFDGRPWRGAVDVVAGGFPCQDISAAGKGAGLAGARSGLWFEMLRIIGEVRPAFVWAENSPLLRTRGLGTILQGLASLGYDCRWGVVGASHAGAPHRRKRLWLLAHARSELLRDEPRGCGGEDREGRTFPGDHGTTRHVAHANGRGQQEQRQPEHGTVEGAPGREPHRRGEAGRGEGEAVGDSHCPGLEERQGQCCDHGQERKAIERAGGGGDQWWKVEPEVR